MPQYTFQTRQADGIDDRSTPLALTLAILIESKAVIIVIIIIIITDNA